MYKLLTTTAVILAVASPSLAWDGAENLTKNLETIYTNLQGGTEFDALQGTVTGTTGQLSEFYGTVSQGVTHLTLTTDDNNNITAVVVPGTSFADINEKKTNLVNRVNYDLFVNEESGVDTFVAGTQYDVVKFNLTESSSNPADKNYATDHSAGLAGRKIDKLVTDVNTVNDFLVHKDTTKTLSTAFQNEWTAGTGSTAGVDVAVIQTHVSELNTAINTARLGTTDGTGYFGETALAAIDETNINNFIIPNYNDFNSIGDPAASNGFSSISDWANGYETVVATAGTYRYEGTGVATSDGTTISIDGNPVTDPDNTAGLTKIN